MSGKVSNYRNVNVNFSVSPATAGSAAPLDYFKAALKKVEEIEYKYAMDSSSVSNYAAVAITLTGRVPKNTYKATLTCTISTGTYAFVYGSTVTDTSSLP